MLTKKHFIALGTTIKEMPTHTVGKNIKVVKYEDMLDALVAFCRGENPYFSEDTFRGYVAGTCGPSGGKVKAK